MEKFYKEFINKECQLCDSQGCDQSPECIEDCSKWINFVELKMLEVIADFDKYKKIIDFCNNL